MILKCFPDPHNKINIKQKAADLKATCEIWGYGGGGGGDNEEFWLLECDTLWCGKNLHAF